MLGPAESLEGQQDKHVTLECLFAKVVACELVLRETLLLQHGERSETQNNAIVCRWKPLLEDW
jgi:hypothetical protein